MYYLVYTSNSAPKIAKAFIKFRVLAVWSPNTKKKIQLGHVCLYTLPSPDFFYYLPHLSRFFYALMESVIFLYCNLLFKYKRVYDLILSFGKKGRSID